MAYRHHHLDHTSNTSSGLGVANIGLHRPQQQWLLNRPVLPIRRQQRLRLDWITKLRPRPVRLHHIHIAHRQTRIRQSLTNHPLLRRTVRRRQTIRRTILVHRRTRHHRQDLMPIPPSI
jgi:hypothetical protein